jgi:acetyl esterase/lipase
MWRLYVAIYRFMTTNGDKKRENDIPVPTGLDVTLDVAYSQKRGKSYLLDVARPHDDKVYPLIIIVHGGGWVYGNKELYHKYALDLARRGFVTMCFNYPLAPHKSFPTQLYALDDVCSFASSHSKEFNYDPNSIFMVGDSAGAQMSAQYCSAISNPKYNALFNFKGLVKIKALGLNCGTYSHIGSPLIDPKTSPKLFVKGQNALLRAYVGRTKKDDPRLDILPNITSKFPPSYVITSEKDFIKQENPALIKVLKDNNVPYVFKEYTSKEGDKLQHVFHLIINEEHAIEANDEETAFLKEHLN